jgi:minimal PKS acyl carrier protein
MNTIDTPTVLRILGEAAGEDADIELTDGATDPTLTDLGFDSLVLIEATARIERELGAAIPEDRLADVTTVADLRSLVNEFLPAARPR